MKPSKALEKYVDMSNEPRYMELYIHIWITGSTKHMDGRPTFRPIHFGPTFFRQTCFRPIHFV